MVASKKLRTYQRHVAIRRTKRRTRMGSALPPCPEKLTTKLYGVQLERVNERERKFVCEDIGPKV